MGEGALSESRRFQRHGSFVVRWGPLPDLWGGGAFHSFHAECSQGNGGRPTPRDTYGPAGQKMLDAS